MYNIFLSVILNVITMYIIISWISNLVRVLVTCIRHLDVHNFTYIGIFVRLLYIFVYMKPK